MSTRHPNALAVCLLAAACTDEPNDAPDEAIAALFTRPIDFPELICRDAQGTGANLYMFRSSNTYSEIVFYQSGIRVSSQFQEQEINFSTSTIYMVPSNSTLRYGQTPYIFTWNGVSYPCITGAYFESCTGQPCLQPPVYVGTSPPPPPPTPTATTESMIRALEAQRSAAIRCAPTYHGTIEISAAFDTAGDASAAAVRKLSFHRLSSRARSCMEVAFGNASGAGGAGTITHKMSL